MVEKNLIRIAHIVPSLKNSGVIRVVQGIIASLEGVAYQKVFYFDEKNDLLLSSEKAKINIGSIKELKEYDIIHTHMFRPDLLVCVLHVFGFLKKQIKVTTIHQFIDHDLTGRYNFLKAYLAKSVWNFSHKYFNTIVTLNKLMHDEYQKKFKNLNVVEINNGLSLGEINEGEGIGLCYERIREFKDKYYCIGAAAQITKNKGFDIVLEAMPSDPSIGFILIGDGPNLKSLIVKAKKLNIENRILFLGEKMNAKKYFNFFDLFVMSSEKEGFPIALLEAAFQSIPVICSDNKIFRGFFKENEVSFFSTDSTGSFIKAINKVRENKENFGENIYRCYRENYTNEKMGQKYINLYSEIINK